MDKKAKKDKNVPSESVKDERFANILQNPVYRRVPKKEKKVEVDKRFQSIDVKTIDYTRGDVVLPEEDSSSDESSSEEELNEQDVIQEWGEMDRDADRTEEATNRLALCNMDWDRLTAEDLMALFHSFLPAGGVLKCVTIYPSEFGKERLAEEEVNGPKELMADKVNSSDSEEDDDEDNEEGSGYNMEKLRTYQLKRLKYYYAILEFDTKESADKVYTECDGMEYESSATRVDLRFVPEDMSFDDEPKDKCDAVPNAQKYRPRFFVTTALQQAKVDLTWDETDPKRKELIGKIYDSKEKIEDEDIKAYLASSSSESEGEKDGGDNDSDEEGDKKDTLSRYKALLQSIDDTEKKKKDKDVEMEITWGVGLKQKSEQMVKKKLEKEEIAKMTPWEEMLAKRREKRKTRKSDSSKAPLGKSDDNNSDSESKIKSESDSEDEESNDDDDDDNDNEAFSDDSVDIDMNDPFFKEELSTNEIFKQSNKKNKKHKNEGKLGNKKKIEDSNHSVDEEREQAELELLMMDEEQDNKKHFSLKKIMDAESESTSKKKKRNKKKKLSKNGEDTAVDDFQVDLKDDRFSALYSSHHYNVDPSNPGFRKTKGMEAIIMEKQQRRSKPEKPADNNDFRPEAPSTSKEMTRHDESQEEFLPTAAKKSKSELSYLVKSIKGKTQSMSSKKQNNIMIQKKLQALKGSNKF